MIAAPVANIAGTIFAMSNFFPQAILYRMEQIIGCSKRYLPIGTEMKAGRPRGFDRDAFLLKIQRIFWKHGFEATALSQLTDVTGLHKPSLYAAYGDKKALYLAALDAYLATSAEMVSTAFSAPSLKIALNRFFEADLDLFLSEQAQGCFLLATGVPVAGFEPDVAKRVAAGLTGLRSAFEGRLKTAQRMGELGTEIDIVAVADELYSTHIALAVRARAGESRPKLLKTVRRVLDRLLSI